jgi:hypothetical protein
MLQEATDERSIQVLDTQGGGGLLEAALSEGKEETKGVAVIRDCVRAGIALVHKPLREEGLEQLGEGREAFHRFASFRTQRRVAKRNNSGAASRYQ